MSVSKPDKSALWALIRRGLRACWDGSRQLHLADEAGCSVALAKLICANGKVSDRMLPRVLDVMERRLEERRVEIDRTLTEIRQIRGHDVAEHSAECQFDRSARALPRGAGGAVLLHGRGGRVPASAGAPGL